MNFLNNFPKEKIIETIKTSYSPNEVLYKLGASKNSGSNKTTLKNFIKTNNIDISHFKGIPEEEIFINPSFVSQTRLRREFLKKSKNDYICSICGQEPTWNGKPLTLRIDHINGRNKDNRLENLRWVCPNCDSQLPTYGNRASKTKKEKICIKCGAHISKQNKSGLCKNCKSHKNSIQQKDDNKRNCSYNLCSCGNRKKISAALCVSCENKRRIKKGIKTREEKYGITRETLKEQIRITPFTTIAKTYRVSDNAIRKWCKYYGLPSKTKEITSISDEDWKNI